MARVLISWIGHTDLRAARGEISAGLGPVGQAVTSGTFDEVFLLSDYKKDESQVFSKWLGGQRLQKLRVISEPLSSPTDYSEIYAAAVRACQTALANRKDRPSLVFHLSPGTPAMAAIWVLISKTRFPAELIESSQEHGVKTVSIPFDIAVEFIPDLLRERDETLRRMGAIAPPEAPAFADIVHRSRDMARLVHRAELVAAHDAPVLIEGESGTGKELFARAIHRASPRRDSPFIAVNCGAIPSELVESELFGHEKGAFTGADQRRVGLFEAADGGTLLLDELGELPPPAQVKLLRTLQEREIVRVGATKATKVDVRIIAATNRALIEEIALGRFREDLFYRLAVAVLRIPPLREREGDMGPLIDHVFAQLSQRNPKSLGTVHKKLSAGAKNILLQHSWPGNVRELSNTLQRLVIWSEGPTISAEEVREALFPVNRPGDQPVLGLPMGNGFDLQSLIANIARHYLDRAMSETHGNKTKAAELVGLSSYQTLTNWLKRYGVRGPQ